MEIDSINSFEEGYQTYYSSAALHKASSFYGVTWKAWSFTQQSNVLVLCLYRSAFEVIGYLAFRSPIYVRIPTWFEGKAEFILANVPTEIAGHHFEMDSDKPQNVIVIRSEGQEYSVICDGIAFYQLVDAGAVL